ncbi:MMPL family transporter [Jonesia denitrificans]|nr:MMPL family transporter [Jonesia denitrificans]SQH19674.1 Putative membrane protein ydgH [Jonesia denitrificans]
MASTRDNTHRSDTVAQPNTVAQPGAAVPAPVAGQSMAAVPPNTTTRTGLAERLVSRRGAWVSILLALVVMVALFGAFSSVEAPQRSGKAPASSESAQVADILATFPDADTQTVLLVATRTDTTPLTPADHDTLTSIANTLTTNDSPTPPRVLISDDGNAALITHPITVGDTNSDTATTINELRERIGTLTPPVLTITVTGGPAFGADIASAFDGADITLLLITIGIVAVLLIGTYRSPILWLIPLTVVALADGLAGRITATTGTWLNLDFDAGIISVLMFGASTNYALLLISRYREELTTTPNHRDALATAWRATLPAILASNVTVVLALLSLIFATIPLTRGLGVPAAHGPSTTWCPVAPLCVDHFDRVWTTTICTQTCIMVHTRT